MNIVFDCIHCGYEGEPGPNTTCPQCTEGQCEKCGEKLEKIFKSAVKEDDVLKCACGTRLRKKKW